MPRRRRRGGWGYLPVIIVLVVALLLVTGVLRVQVTPEVQLPEGVTIPTAVEVPAIQLPLVNLPIITTPVPNASTAPAAAPTPPVASLRKRTKTSGCVAQNGLPDQACTPGAVFPSATKEQICVPGYSSSVRDVSSSLKDETYAEYGIQQHSPGEYEVDHLVPLELGGSNDIGNLWPEVAEPRPGFHEKDKVENYLRDQVCRGALPLTDAQVQIATNWLSVYQRLPTK